MKTELKNIADEDYFAIGDLSKEMTPVDSHKKMVVSASFVKSTFRTNLYHSVLFKDKVDEELQKIFDIGSAFHCFILENDDFYDRYYVSDTPDITSEKVRISLLDFEFMERSNDNIKIKYPQMLDGLNCELAIFSEMDGVPVKCKIDKMNITRDKKGNFIHVDIVDLKSVYFKPFTFNKNIYGERTKLRYKLSDTGYDIQAYFYIQLVKLWLESINQSCSVSFSLLTASKEDYHVQMFKVGDEMLKSGEMKFGTVWGEVVDFWNEGKSALALEEVL